MENEGHSPCFRQHLRFDRRVTTHEKSIGILNMSIPNTVRGKPARLDSHHQCTAVVVAHADLWACMECCTFSACGGVRLCCGEGLLCPVRASQRHHARAQRAPHGMRAPLRTSAHLSLGSFARRQALTTRSSLRPHRPARAEGVVVSGRQSRCGGWTAGRAGLRELRFRSRVAPGRRVPARGALTPAHNAERGELAQKEEFVVSGEGA